MFQEKAAKPTQQATTFRDVSSFTVIPTSVLGDVYCPMGRGKRRHQRALDAAKMDVLRDADLLVLIFSELSSVAQLAQADAVCQEWHKVGRSNA